MKMRVVELPHNGARIKGGPSQQRLKKGFYLIFGKEVLAGPFINNTLCYNAKAEWIMPGERVTAY